MLNQLTILSANTFYLSLTHASLIWIDQNIRLTTVTISRNHLTFGIYSWFFIKTVMTFYTFILSDKVVTATKWLFQLLNENSFLNTKGINVLVLLSWGCACSSSDFLGMNKGDKQDSIRPAVPLCVQFQYQAKKPPVVFHLVYKRVKVTVFSSVSVPSKKLLLFGMSVSAEPLRRTTVR